MRKLQNNYTTQEQSKRLLELGVPAWTADFYYTEFGKIEIKNTALDTLYPSCWSVGRLIEIYHICVCPGSSFTFHVCFPNLMHEVMYKIVEAKHNGWLDFSKLEE